MNGFTPDILLTCYERGVFPMAESAEDDQFYLVDPPLRGLLPLDRFHLPRRLKRTVRQDRFEVRVDTQFDAVVDFCAQSAPGREDTWINPTIRRLYSDLFAQGHAHCVECWDAGQLVGGLYGVRRGGAFFGESMFSRQRDASKVALVHLVARLIAGGFSLLDTQFITEHLTQFGAEEISRQTYLNLLARALRAEAQFYSLSPSTSGSEALAVLQLIGQTS